MKTETKKIGTRELLRDIKKIKDAVKKGQEFEVLDRATPLFRIVPINTPKRKKYTFADLAALQFSTTEQDISKRVDEIVYGIE
jgi:antitoxin (DNA-binding transcriptional repressor) of toxin-antitoxin stability system